MIKTNVLLTNKEIIKEIYQIKKCFNTSQLKTFGKLFMSKRLEYLENCLKEGNFICLNQVIWIAEEYIFDYDGVVLEIKIDENQIKADLIDKLKSVDRRCRSGQIDVDEAFNEADDLLLEYLDDPEIYQAYWKIDELEESEEEMK